MKIYILSNISYPNGEDDYKLIGLFSSLNKVEKIIKYYSKKVNGFNSYDNKFIVEKFNVKGNYRKQVWLLQSYKLNKDTEVDIKNIGIYHTYLEAKIKKLNHIIQINDKETKYYIELHTVDKALWKDGFIRT